MKAKALFPILSAGLFAFVAQNAAGQTLYQQNFENPVTLGSSTTGPGGFVQLSNLGNSGWQVQGGGGGTGVTLTAGVDNNGFGGSQGLFANWDHSLATGFTFNQYTIYGGVSAPGAGVLASQIQISLRIYMNGSESSTTPLQVILQNNGNDLAFTPTLANGAYSSVTFTLDQASNAGLFNPTMSSNLRIQHGAGGFGFDAGNIVELDDISIQVVPEPCALSLLGFGALAFLKHGRRRGI